MLDNIKNLERFTLIAILIACTFLTFIGLYITPDSLSSPWTIETQTALAIWSSGCFVGSIIIRKIFTQHAAIIFLFSIIVVLALGTGILQALTVVVFLLSLYTAGTLTLHWIFPSDNQTAKIRFSLITGTALYIALLSISLHYPINYRLTYLLALLLPITIYFSSKNNRKLFKNNINSTITYVNQQALALPYWQCCLATAFIGFIGTFVFIPSVMHDDHIFHLAMWSQVEYHHKFHFDIEIQKWSAAPFALDSLHTFISILAGADGRAALNLGIFFILLTSIWQAAGHIFSENKKKLLAVILFVSTPMLANLLISLQTELFLALLTTVGIGLIAEKNISCALRTLLVFLICCLLCATKLPAGLIAVSLAISLLIGHWQQLSEILRQPSLIKMKLFILVLISIYIAFHAYINAYLISGNPVYPLFNERFNPTSDVSGISNSIFIGSPSLKAFIGFFFNSSHYFESKNFIAGFQYLLLPVVGIIYGLLTRKYLLLIYLTLPIIIFGGAMFMQMQYWRYLFPVLPLASLLVVLPFSGEVLNNKITAQLSTATLSLYILLNLFYLPGVSWLFHTNQLNCFSTSGKVQFEENHMPEALLNRYVNQTYPNAKVLTAAGRPYGATLWGTPVYATRAAPTTFNTFKSMQSTEALLNYLQQENITLIYWNDADVDLRFPFQKMIKDIIATHATKEKTIGAISLYKINF